MIKNEGKRELKGTINNILNNEAQPIWLGLFLYIKVRKRYYCIYIC